MIFKNEKDTRLRCIHRNPVKDCVEAKKIEIART